MPADRLPAGIGIAFRPCPPQGRGQPVRVGDELGCRPCLDANGLAGWVFGVGIDTQQAPVFDRGETATTGNAEGAVGRHDMGHDGHPGEVKPAPAFDIRVNADMVVDRRIYLNIYLGWINIGLPGKKALACCRKL